MSRPSLHALLFAAAALAACGDGATAPVGGTPRPVAQVELQAPASTLEVGGWATFVATPRTADGTAIPDVAVSWSSTDTTVATVSAQGRVTARGVGSASIRAAAGGRTGEVAITVVPEAVSLVLLAPSAPGPLFVGDVRPFTAEARAADGRVLERPVTWSSSNPAVATVASDGRVTGVSIGVTTIRAAVDGRIAEAVQVVTLASVASVAITTGDSVALYIGQSVTMVAEARSADGRLLTGRNVGWRSSDATVAVVDPAGRVTAVTAGTAEVIASVEGVEAHVAVRVQPNVVRVDVQPGFAAMQVGEVEQFSALALTADGHALNLPIAWNSSDTSVVVVIGVGRVHARAPGRAWVSATVEGVTGRVEVEVQPDAGVLAVLRFANDSALPRLLFTRQEADGQGGTRAVRHVAQGGTLRLHPSTQRYEQRFDVRLEREGSPAQGGTLVFTGRWSMDFAGRLVFQPDGGQPLFRLTATAFDLLDGRQQLYGDVEPVRLVYQVSFGALRTGER